MVVVVVVVLVVVVVWYCVCEYVCCGCLFLGCLCVVFVWWLLHVPFVVNVLCVGACVCGVMRERGCVIVCACVRLCVLTF